MSSWTRGVLISLAILACAGLWWTLRLPPPDAPDLIGHPAAPVTATLTPAPSARVGAPVFEQPVISQTDAPDPTPRVTELDPPESTFRESDYGKTRMDIYFEFHQDAQNWTSDDYFRHAAMKDQLDGEQAYQVYVYLRTCLDEPRSPDQLEQQQQRLQQQNLADADSMPDDALARRVERMRDSVVRCEGLESLPQPLESVLIDWLTRAADLGYAQAQLAYHQSIRWLLGRQRPLIYRQPERVHEYRQKASSHLQQVLGTGHTEAFVENAQALMEGVIVERDPLLAYGHAHAADLASHGQSQQARNFQAILEPELDSDQRREARDLGRQLCQAYCR